MSETPKRALKGPYGPRPGRYSKRRPRPRVDHVLKRGDSMYVGEDLRREINFVAQAYGVTLGEVVRTFVEAHRAELDVEFERHRKMIE